MPELGENLWRAVRSWLRDPSPWQTHMHKKDVNIHAHTQAPQEANMDMKNKNKKMLCKHTQVHAHTLSLIPSSHLYTCATRFAITHAPSPSRVLHCSTFTPLELERRRAHWASTLTLTQAQKGKSRWDMHTYNAKLRTKACIHANVLCTNVHMHMQSSLCKYKLKELHINHTTMCSCQYAHLIPQNICAWNCLKGL